MRDLGEVRLIDGPYTRYHVKRQVGPANDRTEHTVEVVREIEEDRGKKYGVTIETAEGPTTVTTPLPNRAFAEFYHELERMEQVLEQLGLDGGD